jgi:glycosyltransferase involved in cell wall biosynthesis
MRVTICAFDAPNNLDGPTTWIKRLLPYFKEKNIESRIIFLAANDKDLPAYNYFVNEGYECKLIYWELFNDEKILEILNDVKKFPPDIFIANYFAIALEAGKWIKKAGIPTVMVLHNDNQYHYDLVKKYAANNYETDVSSVVCVSNLIQEISKKIAPFHQSIRYIPIGAPITADVTHAAADNILKIVYAGRIEEHQKKISEVTEAFCEAAKEIPGTSYTIYGAGDAVPSVLKIIKTSGKGLPVKFAGKLKSTDVQAHLIKSQVYVLLSDFEGLPITLMEAMSCGLVPVCTNIRSGITDLVTNNVEGILVNDRKGEFISAIKKLKDNPDLWQKMSAASRQKIITSYSVESCSNQWVMLLNDLLKTAVKPTSLVIPPATQLKKFRLSAEFKEHDNTKPATLLVPLYKVKAKLGRIKRKLF